MGSGMTSGAERATTGLASPDAGVVVAHDAAHVRTLLGATDPRSWPHPDAEPEYFLTVVDALPGVVRPHVVRIARADGTAITVVARLEDVTLDVKVGYRSVHRPRVRCLTVVHGGVAGMQSRDDALRVLQELREPLGRGEADVIRFLGLHAESPLYAAACSVPPWSCRDHLAVAQPHWRVAVPGSLAEFLAARSGNTRQNVKRYGKRFERDFEGRLEIRRFGADADTDVERLFADLETIASKTYQRGLGVGFTGDALQRRLAELDLPRGRYLAWVLDIDGTPSAFWDGTAHVGTFFIGSPGYDPALASHRVGVWLQMRMMEDLCARPDVTALDYGMGDAQYKRSFGDECWMDAILHVFAGTAKGVRVNAARTAAMGVTHTAQRMLERAGIEDRVKRGWRRRLQSGDAA